MPLSKTLANRMRREFQLLENQPPTGIGAWSKDDSLHVLAAQMTGPEGTPYAGGTFHLEVVIPDRYPFEPPKIRFLTPIYHPNIDTGGRICLDTLKMPPRGSWKPSLNIATTLATVRLLVGNANADDGLMPEVTRQYKTNRRLFDKTARMWTTKHAMGGGTASAAGQEGGGGVDTGDASLGRGSNSRSNNSNRGSNSASGGSGSGGGSGGGSGSNKRKGEDTNAEPVAKKTRQEDAASAEPEEQSESEESESEESEEESEESEEEEEEEA
jgi:ubiquitin-conjugating enzyme E2 T